MRAVIGLLHGARRHTAALLAEQPTDDALAFLLGLVDLTYARARAVPAAMLQDTLQWWLDPDERELYDPAMALSAARRRGENTRPLLRALLQVTRRFAGRWSGRSWPKPTTPVSSSAATRSEPGSHGLISFAENRRRKVENSIPRKSENDRGPDSLGCANRFPERNIRCP
jgi:hypothetical protein